MSASESEPFRRCRNKPVANGINQTPDAAVVFEEVGYDSASAS